MRSGVFTFVAWFIAFASADVRFLAPTAGSTIHGDGALTVSWEDSGNAPLLSELASYELFLCAGGNDDSTIVQLRHIVLGGKFSITGNKAEAAIPASIGGSTPNAYFLKMISVSATGGTIINYSSRFSMSDMTGVFTDQVISGLKSVTGTNGPASVINMVNGNDADSVPKMPRQDMYAIPFADQSGPLRYASMQKVPPTKITKATKTPINPTSLFTIATTFLPPNTDIKGTVAAPITWSFSQMEHTGSPLPMPSDAMQRFLNRWRD